MSCRRASASAPPEQGAGQGFSECDRDLVARGLSNDEIARDRAQLVIAAYQGGLVTPA
jgi:hypothetical protein